MLSLIKKEDCCGCAACMQACPRQCIKMTFDEEGFQYPKVNVTNCVKCGLCEKVCPIRQKRYKQELDAQKVYIAYAKSDEIRLHSSSGGIFTLLAESCIKENGAVYGAAFTDTFDVCHVGVEKAEDIAKLQGSKYIQSKVGNSYIEVKERLKNNQKVVFSGTPCQIAGLKSYLKDDYDNLITVDILCHGVPSEKLWKKYVEEQEMAHASSVRRTFFRHKKYGWKKYAVLLEFSNNTAYERVFTQDPFMQMLLANISLRPSCYNCRFKEMPHLSDITLGDCWGVQQHSPEMDDNKGTSVVLLNTAKGKCAFEKILPNLQYKECSLDCAVSPDAESRQKIRKHPNRKRFFKKLDEDSIEGLMCYMKASILTRGVYKVARKLGIDERQPWNCIETNKESARKEN